MHAIEIHTCRGCGHSSFESILDFGDMHFTGRFQYDGKPKVPTGPLHMVKCTTCHLVQLKHNFALDELYMFDYGYRSGVNQTMSSHLSSIASEVASAANLKPGDRVLDIGSNDATLLKSYEIDGLVRFGMDPTSIQFAEYYPPEITAIPDFFDADNFHKSAGNDPLAAVTSVAVIYDLPDPNKFFGDICKIISDQGIWVFEQSYMPRMLEQSAYDSICHEHIEYYTLNQVDALLKNNGLKIFDVSFNDMNGGSFRVFTCRDQASYERRPVVDEALQKEAEMGFDTMAPYQEFVDRVSEVSRRLVRFLNKEKAAGKSILGYGASTKGNTLLQYCGIDASLISAIADRNPTKWGAKTPKSDIPIISEEDARALNPDYFLVLPWHFRDEFLSREAEFLAGGGSFIFALPELTVVSQDQKITVVE
jgi:NDP-4-keto-2,6-dideoxyhexose 3-C-methyltransferase